MSFTVIDKLLLSNAKSPKERLALRILGRERGEWGPMSAPGTNFLKSISVLSARSSRTGSKSRGAPGDGRPTVQEGARFDGGARSATANRVLTIMAAFEAPVTIS